MFRLLRWVSRASAQRVARLAAATCSGVCQNLSRAFASAPRLSSRPTALWGEGSNNRAYSMCDTAVCCTFFTQHNNLVQFYDCCGWIHNRIRGWDHLTDRQLDCLKCWKEIGLMPTSFLEAAALCNGVNHTWSLAFTVAPGEINKYPAAV